MPTHALLTIPCVLLCLPISLFAMAYCPSHAISFSRAPPTCCPRAHANARAHARAHTRSREHAHLFCARARMRVLDGARAHPRTARTARTALGACTRSDRTI
eukprot:6171980-Pleurochrysis_carterae.AAC.2